MTITLTAEDMNSMAAVGRYWWVRSDGTCYATADREPADPADMYLLDASPEWIEQWGGDWSAAADALQPLLLAAGEGLM